MKKKFSFNPCTGKFDWTNSEEALFGVGFIDFNLGYDVPTAEGRLKWNPEDGTLEVGMPGGNVNQQIGLEQLLKISNDELINMPNGGVFYISGATGITPDAKLGSSGAIETSGVIAVATEEITSAQKGYGTTFGLVRDLDTSGFSEGEILWLSSTPGQFTNVKPTAPELKVEVGVCLRSHPTGGAILVNISRIPRLQDLSDVYAPSLSNRDLLQWNSTTLRFENLINPSLLTKEPTGFIDNENVTISYDTTERKITLTGNVLAYYKGEQVTELFDGWVSDAHPDISGTYFLTYGDDGFEWRDLSLMGVDFTEVLIAYAAYNGSYKLALREPHGLMQWQSHEEAHNNIGTYRDGGGDLGDYVLSSTTPADRRPSVSETIVKDEDIPTTNAVLAAGGPYTQFYLTGADSSPAFNLSSADIVPLLTARPYYNQWTGATWQQTLISNNFYMSIWLVAIPTTTDAASQQYRFVWVQGQSESITLSAQQDIAPASISLGKFNAAIPELVFLAKVIIRYIGGNWQIEAVQNLTGNRFSQIGSPAGNYLSSVSTDTTINGLGTASIPLSVSGIMPIASKTTDYTLTSSDSTVICTAALTLTLPDATSLEGKKYFIKSKTTGQILINAHSGQTVEDSSSYTISQLNASITIQADSSLNWNIF